MVLEIQCSLRTLGYDVALNGASDDRVTRDAISSFRARKAQLAGRNATRSDEFAPWYERDAYLMSRPSEALRTDLRNEIKERGMEDPGCQP